VRELVVSDSCFSGSVIRDDRTTSTPAPVRRPAALRGGGAAVSDRRAPTAQVRAVWRANGAEYAARKAAVAASHAVEPAAGIILLAACKDLHPPCVTVPVEQGCSVAAMTSLTRAA
jgi:hypothetical protein